MRRDDIFPMRIILAIVAVLLVAQVVFDVWMVVYRNNSNESLRAQRTLNNSFVRSLSDPSGNITPPEGCRGRPVVWQEPKGLGC